MRAASSACSSSLTSSTRLPVVPVERRELLLLVCSDRNITKIFEITGLDRVFTIYPTRVEAVEQLDGSKPSA